MTDMAVLCGFAPAHYSAINPKSTSNKRNNGPFNGHPSPSASAQASATAAAANHLIAASMAGMGVDAPPSILGGPMTAGEAPQVVPLFVNYGVNNRRRASSKKKKKRRRRRKTNEGRSFYTSLQVVDEVDEDLLTVSSQVRWGCKGRRCAWVCVWARGCAYGRVRVGLGGFG